MFTGKLFLSVMLSLVGFICLYPQVKDTTEDKDDSWIYSYCNFSQFKYSFSGSPTISANYGLSKTSVENFNESFAKPDLIELKLGYTHEQKNFKANNIIDYRFSYFYLSNISVDLSGNSSAGSGLKTDLWRTVYRPMIIGKGVYTASVHFTGISAAASPPRAISALSGDRGLRLRSYSPGQRAYRPCANLSKDSGALFSEDADGSASARIRM